MDKKNKNEGKIVKKNLNKKDKANRTNILIPHYTNLNNLKSKKYFTNTTTNSYSMKIALIKYRENYNINNNQNCISHLTNSSISTCNNSKLNINKKVFKFDKEIINFAEPRTKTSFQKIAPKLLELSSNEQINTNEDIDEFKIYKNKNNLNINKVNLNNIINEKNQNLRMNISEKILFNLNIDEINYEEDSIDFDINTEDDIEFNANNDNLTNRNKNSLNIGINLHDINFKECIKIENLFNELIKDLEVNKMNEYNNKLKIVKNFLSIFNDKNNYNLFLTFDINSLNNTLNKKIGNKSSNENIFLIIKEYLIQQLVFFYIIILIGLIKKDSEKNIYLSGLQNLSFYFHQNFQVFNFILTSRVNKNNINLLTPNELLESYEKCLNMVKENKTWFNENNYQKCLQINNKMSKQVIKNLFEQMRIYFTTNPYFNNNDIYKNKKKSKSPDNKIKTLNPNIKNINNNFLNKNKNDKSVSKKNEKNDNILKEDFIDSDINLFLEYIKSYKNVKFTSLLKELKYSPSINYLIEKSKMLNNNNNNINKNNHVNLKIKKNHSYNKQNDKSNRCISSKTPDNTQPKAPFLKAISSKYKYTLVLDLDETLIHYEPLKELGYIQIRPGAEDFIKELSEFYEIVIFTESNQTYANLVICGIDTQNKISEKLYKQHTLVIGDNIIKDLDKLGRDLKKVIIVDNCCDSYCLQPKNGISIIDFNGNEEDDILQYLKKDLIKLVKINPEDVRLYLKEIQINMNKRGNEILNNDRQKKRTDIYNNKINNKNIENKFKKERNKSKNSLINDNILESIKENEFENTIISEKMENNSNVNNK